MGARPSGREYCEKTERQRSSNGECRHSINIVACLLCTCFKDRDLSLPQHLSVSYTTVYTAVREPLTLLYTTQITTRYFASEETSRLKNFLLEAQTNFSKLNLASSRHPYRYSARHCDLLQRCKPNSSLCSAHVSLLSSNVRVHYTSRSSVSSPTLIFVAHNRRYRVTETKEQSERVQVRNGETHGVRGKKGTVLRVTDHRRIFSDRPAR